MPRHTYAEFFEALANNEGDQWAERMKDGTLMDIYPTCIGEIYTNPEWYDIVRKPAQDMASLESVQEQLRLVTQQRDRLLAEKREREVHDERL